MKIHTWNFLILITIKMYIFSGHSLNSTLNEPRNKTSLKPKFRNKIIKVIIKLQKLIL